MTRQSLWIWRGKGLPNDAKLLRRIEAALDLLDLILASPDPRFGRAFLLKLMREMAFPEEPEQARSPSLLSCWGSGIPDLHLRRFAEAAVKLEIPVLLGLTPEAFEAEMLLSLRDLRRSPKTP